MLRRNSGRHQVPAALRALEPDEDRVTGWIKERGRKSRGTAAPLGAWLVFQDEAGFSIGSAKIFVQR
ncbi:hypothetical protein ACIP98_41410 [Streptomyces sp. NPDC088354]|uniref:hypothetical protein n=1 Tax=Streptomyces sp. NPDC088354 TaxID=3365856 RepID=UPI0037FE09A6